MNGSIVKSDNHCVDPTLTAHPEVVSTSGAHLVEVVGNTETPTV